VLHLRLIILSVGGDVPIDGEVLWVTNFVNLKIKPAQSFRGAHRDRVCMRVFIGVSTHTCMSIYIYTMFLKKIYENWKSSKESHPSRVLFIGPSKRLKTKFPLGHSTMKMVILGVEESDSACRIDPSVFSFNFTQSL
jgi:hypothetical protein